MEKFGSGINITDPQHWSRAMRAQLCSGLCIRAAGLLRERTEELARLDVRDNGKPIWEAR
jgi:acyl-CoA reductase-like NAD-dependent aldehyde dehydrogenase